MRRLGREIVIARDPGHDRIEHGHEDHQWQRSSDPEARRVWHGCPPVTVGLCDHWPGRPIRLWPVPGSRWWLGDHRASSFTDPSPGVSRHGSASDVTIVAQLPTAGVDQVRSPWSRSSTAHLPTAGLDTGTALPSTSLATPRLQPQVIRHVCEAPVPRRGHRGGSRAVLTLAAKTKGPP